MCARWNRFDICEAWYLYASHFHTGQASALYRVLGRLERMGFRPSPLLSVETLSDNAREIYTRHAIIALTANAGGNK